MKIKSPKFLFCYFHCLKTSRISVNVINSGPGQFNLFTTQKKKKKVIAMVKHRNPRAQTQEYPKYTQTVMGEIQKPL